MNFIFIFKTNTWREFNRYKQAVGARHVVGDESKDSYTLVFVLFFPSFRDIDIGLRKI